MTMENLITGTGRNNIPPGALRKTYTNVADLSADTVASVTLPTASNGNRARWVFTEAELDYWIDSETIPTVNPKAAVSDGSAPMKNVLLFEVPEDATTIYWRSLYAQQIVYSFYS